MSLALSARIAPRRSFCYDGLPGVSREAPGRAEIPR